MGGQESKMPDFTVIDGGGKGRSPPDFDAAMARQHMDTLILEILRALARGTDHENRVGRAVPKPTGLHLEKRAFEENRQHLKALRLAPDAQMKQE
jgi:hypothetical protein